MASKVQQVLGRWIGLGALVLSYSIAQSLAFPFRQQINRRWASMLLKMLRIRTLTRGRAHLGHKILVANHISWLDPIALTSLTPSTFITSTDTRRDPFLGSICSLAGCSFVSRNPWSLPKEIAIITRKLKRGESPAFFPEATSGNGCTLMPFRPALFELAMQTKLPIQPVRLRWNSSVFAYYGNMQFGSHLRKVLAQPHAILEIEYLPCLWPKDFQDRKALCQAAQALIQQS